MKTSKKGQDLIKKFEGFKPYGYDLGDGVITAGWGSTSLHHPIKKGVRYDTATLQKWFEDDLKNYEKAVQRFMPNANQNQFDALVSFAYNLGAGIFDQYAGLWHLPQDMGNFIMRGTPFEQGLRNRRNQEIALYNTPVNSPVPKDADKATKRLYELGGRWVINSTLYIDEVKKVNGIWQVINYDLAGKKKITMQDWNLRGIPADIITLVDKNGKKLANQNSINPKQFFKFDEPWNHGTIDKYGKTSVGIIFGKYGMIWFNSDALLNKV